MSLTKEGFAKWLKPELEKGEPFSAYWHPKGFALLKTGPRPRCKYKYSVEAPGKPKRTCATWAAAEKLCKEYDVSNRYVREFAVDLPPKPPSETLLKRWRKQVDELRYSSMGQLIVVDFDGKTVNVEGELQL